MDQIKMGAFISKLRKEKKMTQEELAIKLNINSKSVSRWETGTQSPDISILKDLAAELDVTVDELLNGEKENIKYLKTMTQVNSTIDYEKYNKSITKIIDLPKKYTEKDNIVFEGYILGIDLLIHKVDNFKEITIITLKLSDKSSSIIGRIAVSTNVLSEIKIGSSWRILSSECSNKRFDGVSIIKMQQIPKLFNSLQDSEQKKYYFFETLDNKTVKERKKKELANKLI